MGRDQMLEMIGKAGIDVEGRQEQPVEERSHD